MQILNRKMQVDLRETKKKTRAFKMTIVQASKKLWKKGYISRR